MKQALIFYGILILIIGCAKNEPKCKFRDDSVFHVNESDLRKSGIEWIRPQQRPVKRELVFKGQIISKPGNVIVVSTPIPGFIYSFQVQLNEFVNKGDLIVLLKHPYFLDLKTEYLQAKIKFEYCKKMFVRQGELAIEEATSLKKMEHAEMEYLLSEAKLSGLEEKLVLLGIDPQKITNENLDDRAWILAPVSGKIFEINAIKGQFCTNTDIILKISDRDKIYFSGLINSEQKKVLTANQKNNLKFKNYTDIKLEEPVIIESGNKILVESGIDNYKINSADRDRVVVAEYIDTLFNLPANAIFNSKQIAVLSDNSTIQIKSIHLQERTSDSVLVKSSFLSRDKTIISDFSERLVKLLCEEQ